MINNVIYFTACDISDIKKIKSQEWKYIGDRQKVSSIINEIYSKVQIYYFLYIYYEIAIKCTIANITQ